jgi:hypothetical protein
MSASPAGVIAEIHVCPVRGLGFRRDGLLSQTTGHFPG